MGRFLVLFVLSLGVALIAIFVFLFEIIPNKEFSQEERLANAIREIQFDTKVIEPEKTNRSLRFSSSHALNASRVKWESNETLAQVVLSQNPAILTSSPVMSWKALSWDVWHLSTVWPFLLNVLSSHKPLFLLSKESDDGILNDEDENNPTLISEMLFANFIFQSPNSSTYLFYSTNFGVMERLAKLTGDTTWRDFRIYENFEEISARIQSSSEIFRQPSPSLSIAHPGVTLQSRFDEHHLTRVQLIGQARYVLFPPAKHSSFALFPAIHPCHSQSQVILEQINSFDEDSLENERNVKFLQVPHIVAELSPGEVLYIPPYWLVRTENTELSLSLDIKSLSREQVLLSEAQALGIALGNITSSEEKMIAAQVFAVHFLSRIRDLKSPEHFAQRHYHSRYSILFPESGLFMSKLRKTFHCLSDKPAIHSAILSRLDREGIKKGAQYAADRVNDPSISRGVKWIWVGDYIDIIARWAMDDPKMAVAFITTCLNFEQKVPIVEEVLGPSVMTLGKGEEIGRDQDF